MRVYDVAQYILNSIGGEISAMKLQKLCYYSQAWSLAWDDKELFPEEFLRWDNGPVCRELFDLHEGMFFVDRNFIDKSLLSDVATTVIPVDEARRNIDQVLEDYGRYPGCDLSEMTYAEKPWKDTPRNQIITKDCMRKYYKKWLINSISNGKCVSLDRMVTQAE